MAVAATGMASGRGTRVRRRGGLRCGSEGVVSTADDQSLLASLAEEVLTMTTPVVPLGVNRGRVW